MFMGTEEKKSVTFMGTEKNERMKGNKFYLLRSKDGRDKIYPTPDDLWNACCEYFKWVEDNPLKEERAFSTKFGIECVDINKKRAMTLAGLRVRIELSESGYNVYKKRDDYKWVTNAVADVIYSQKFEGAAAGLLNPRIIAMELGLVAKQKLETDVTFTKKNFNDFYNNDKKHK